MKRLLSTLIALVGLAGSASPATCSPDTAPAPFYLKSADRSSRQANLGLPPLFERDRGVSWDGQIGWKTKERAWVFAAALEGSLKQVVRADSPYRLRVAVVKAEKQTGTFVVEFDILDPSGESVELIQLEGTGPRDHAVEEVYPAVAGKIVTTFVKSLLK
jgi:hypothetical protein